MYIPEYAREHYRQTRGSDVQEVAINDWENSIDYYSAMQNANDLYYQSQQIINEYNSSLSICEQKLINSCGVIIDSIVGIQLYGELSTTSQAMKIEAEEIHEIAWNLSTSYSDRV